MTGQEQEKEIPLNVDGFIECPRMGCDGFLGTLAPIPYSHMCWFCYAKYDLSLVDNYQKGGNNTEEERSSGVEEEETVDERLWRIVVEVCKANAVLLLIALVLIVVA